MMTNFELVRQFHQAAGALDPGVPTQPPPERVLLRVKLLREEFREVMEAMDCGKLLEIAKELADLLVVTYGTAVEYGLPMNEIFLEVHRSNMTKIGGPERPDGKLLKGENYRPPDLTSLLYASPQDS